MALAHRSTRETIRAESAAAEPAHKDDQSAAEQSNRARLGHVRSHGLHGEVVERQVILARQVLEFDRCDEITADKLIAQDMKDRMIKSLQATIPSDNNKKIVEDLIKDVTYGDKIKLLESSEE